MGDPEYVHPEAPLALKEEREVGNAGGASVSMFCSETALVSQTLVVLPGVASNIHHWYSGGGSGGNSTITWSSNSAIRTPTVGFCGGGGGGGGGIINGGMQGQPL